MPYENDKNTRSGGKKAVTKKTGASSGSTRSSASSRGQTAGTKSGGTKSGRSTSATSERKTTRSDAPNTKSRPTSASSKSGNASSESRKKTESTQSRAKSTARDDYRRFSEEIRTKEKSERAASQKKTQSTSRSSGKDRKGKSQSRSKLMSVLTYAMIIFAFVALMVTLSMTVFFKTDSIRVVTEGKTYYTEEKIIEVSGIEKGQNIFSIDLDKIEAEVESELPYVEKCEIRRKLPTGIKINIVSTEPAGVVTLQTGARVIISTNGKTLEKLNPLSGIAVSESDIINVSESDISATDLSVSGHTVLGDHSAYIDETALPEITGIVVMEGTEPGEYIVTADETAMATLAQLTELLVKYELPPDKIDLSAGNLYAYYDNRIMIKIGSGTELEAKIQLASEIILNRLSEYDSGRVDVSEVKKGYFTPEYMLD